MINVAQISNSSCLPKRWFAKVLVGGLSVKRSLIVEDGFVDWNDKFCETMWELGVKLSPSEKIVLCLLWKSVERYTKLVVAKLLVATRAALVAVLVLPLGGSTFLSATEVASFDDAQSRKIVELSKAGKCKEAWNAIWPEVLAGSNRATIELVGEMIWGNIQPPLPSATDNKSFSQQESFGFLADLVFFIDPSGTPNFVNEIASTKREFLANVWSKQAFAEYENLNCLTSSDKTVCLNPEKWPGAVNKLSYWNKKFESNGKAGLTARCRGTNG
jgi:hypothetical protein